MAMHHAQAKAAQTLMLQPHNLSTLFMHELLFFPFLNGESLAVKVDMVMSTWVTWDLQQGHEGFVKHYLLALRTCILKVNLLSILWRV